MIKIPDEAVEAAVNAYAKDLWDADARPLDYQHAMTAAIAAALATWPGAEIANPIPTTRLVMSHSHTLILPLSTDTINER